MRTLLFGFMMFILGIVGSSFAADNILIQQPNGQFAIMATTESGGVHTINVVCVP